MKRIKLTKGKYAVVSDVDFCRLNEYSYHASVVNGNLDKCYAARGFISSGRDTTILMHHDILPKKQGFFIDHKDGNGLNNKRSNLRYCTGSQNCANRGARKLSSSRYKGVSFIPSTGKWQARAVKDGMAYYVGVFLSEKDAATAYNKVAKKLHGKFAYINKV